MLVSIIIPTYNFFDYLKLCVQSIQETTKILIEIIIVDDYSDIPLTLQDLDITEGRVKIIRNEENLGFPKSVNRGIREAKGDFICIANNDLVFTPDAIEHLVWHLNNGLDLVGPRTNYCDGPQICLIDRYDNKEELFTASNNFYKKNKHKIWAYHRLIGFCLLMKREVIDKIGLLPEIYDRGNFEDNHFDLQAIEAGYRLGIAKDVFIHHHGSITFKSLGKEYIDILNKNQKIFKDIWSTEKIKELEKINEERIKNGKR